MITTAAEPLRQVVFLGPSLPVEEARDICPAATFLPPARYGDVFSVVEANAELRLIVLIDGCGGDFQPVMHKEILYARERGIAVYGCSDVGALRAAETEQYGMIGHGEVFEIVRGGSAQDGDLAWTYSFDGKQYVRASEPMVNVRATIERALGDNIVSRAHGSLLERTAASIFYQDRKWTTILEAATNAGMRESEAEAFRNWLPTGYVDLKRRDAINLLRLIAQGVPDASRGVPTAPSHYFLALKERERLVARPPGQVTSSSIRNYAALHMPGFDHLTSEALNRELVSIFADVLKLEISAEELQQERERLMRRVGAEHEGEWQAWMRRNDLTAEAAQELFLTSAKCRKLQRWLETARVKLRTTRPILDLMRSLGIYEEWADRAAEWESRPLPQSRISFGGEHMAALWDHHATRTGIQNGVPLEEFAEDRGFPDIAELNLELAKSHARSLAGG